MLQKKIAKNILQILQKLFQISSLLFLRNLLYLHNIFTTGQSPLKMCRYEKFEVKIPRQSLVMMV